MKLSHWFPGPDSSGYLLGLKCWHFCNHSNIEPQQVPRLQRLLSCLKGLGKGSVGEDKYDYSNFLLWPSAHKVPLLHFKGAKVSVVLEDQRATKLRVLNPRKGHMQGLRFMTPIVGFGVSNSWGSQKGLCYIGDLYSGLPVVENSQINTPNGGFTATLGFLGMRGFRDYKAVAKSQLESRNLSKDLNP